MAFVECDKIYIPNTFNHNINIFQDASLVGVHHEYGINDTNNKSVTFKNISIFDSKIIFVGIDVFIHDSVFENTTFEGNQSNKVILDKTEFRGSHVLLENVEELSIKSCYFNARPITDETTTRYMLSVSQVIDLDIIDTIFGLKAIGVTSDKPQETNLGIIMIGVEHAVIKQSVFEHISSKVIKGSVMNIETSSVQLSSCNIISNMAHSGVIYAENDVNITSKNCSYTLNTAKEDGGVYYLKSQVYLKNEQSSFTNNTAIEYFGGVIFAKIDVTLENVRCLFQYNRAPADGKDLMAGYFGRGSVIFAKEFATVNNYQVGYEVYKEVVILGVTVHLVQTICHFITGTFPMSYLKSLAVYSFIIRVGT